MAVAQAAASGGRRKQQHRAVSSSCSLPPSLPPSLTHARDAARAPARSWRLCLTAASLAILALLLTAAAQRSSRRAPARVPSGAEHLELAEDAAAAVDGVVWTLDDRRQLRWLRASLYTFLLRALRPPRGAS